MFNLPIFQKRKLLLAFEYGIMISEVATRNKIELTPEMIVRAEEIMLKEFSSKNPQRIAVDMTVNTLAVFETN